MGACSRETRTSPRGRSGSPWLLWTRETVWGSLARELNVETPETLDDVLVRKAWCRDERGRGGTGNGRPPQRGSEGRAELPSQREAERRTGSRHGEHRAERA